MCIYCNILYTVDIACIHCIRGRGYTYTINLLPRQSMNGDLFLLSQLEKWWKFQGRYSKGSVFDNRTLEENAKKNASTQNGKRVCRVASS